MSASHGHFKVFLSNHVKLNPTRLETLRGHVSAVSNFLTGHEDLLDVVTGDVIPQGSYARRTIIKPHTDKDYDADVLLPMNEVDGWQPRKYVETVHSILENSPRYVGKATKKKRCVQLRYAGEFHVDIVPFVTRSDNRTYITHRTDNRWIPQDPTALTAWFEKRHRLAKSHLVNVIRLMKYVRDRSSAHVPSVVLNTILAGRVSENVENSPYGNLPLTLVNLVEDTRDYLVPYDSPPWVDDQTGQNLADRWTQSDFDNYKSQLNSWADQLRNAYDAPQTESVEKWRKVFGDKFGIGNPKAVSASAKPSGPAPSEQYLSDFGIHVQLDPRFKVRMTGRVQPKKPNGRPRPLPRSGNMVSIGKNLVFKVDECNVPAPVKYYWKVRNYGAEARRRNMERGEIRERGYQIEETTQFAGDHWVQVWVIKDGTAVATDRQPVTIIPNG